MQNHPIVVLDVAGYSARAEADEANATAEVTALRGVLERIAEREAGGCSTRAAMTSCWNLLRV